MLQMYCRQLEGMAREARDAMPLQLLPTVAQA